jgi:hypothetical protein
VTAVTLSLIMMGVCTLISYTAANIAFDDGEACAGDVTGSAAASAPPSARIPVGPAADAR